MRSGCVANLTASRISAEPLRRIRVFQARTYLSCDTGARKLERYRVTVDPAHGPKIGHDLLEVGDQEPLFAELRAFVEGVRTQTAPAIDGRAGRQALALAYRVREAMLESAALSPPE